MFRQQDHPYTVNLDRYYTHWNTRLRIFCAINYYDRHTISSSYLEKGSAETVKWNLILDKVASNIDSAYKSRYLKKVLSLWINEVGKGRSKRVAVLNYMDFHKLSIMPNYLDVRRSSAGIGGWTHAGPGNGGKRTHAGPGNGGKADII